MLQSISMSSSQPLNSSLKDIAIRQYENRSKGQHKYLLSFLEPHFPTLPEYTIKLLTFYIKVIEPNDHDSYNNQQQGMLIIVNNSSEDQDNPQVSSIFQNVGKNKKIIFAHKDQYGLFINYDHYLSCLSLGETSIEQQINFFQSSEYLCSMPKKKYYNILRNSKVLSFTFRQSIYNQNQMIASGESGSGVYLVRQGQLGYFKNIKNQNIQVYRFSSGHLFGIVEQENLTKKRLFTVKCKNSRSIVYQMTEQFFNSYIKSYCQRVIQQKQKKLQQFLNTKSLEMRQFCSTRYEINSRLDKSDSSKLTIPQFSKTQSLSMFTSRDLPSLIKTSKLSSEIEQNELQKVSYDSIRFKGPFQNYPKTLQRSKFMQSQFRQIQKLVMKNQKIEKIRSLSKGSVELNKQQILFNMFSNSWKFGRQKRSRQI